MKNDYETAAAAVIGSAGEVILGRKVQDAPYESDLEQGYFYMEDDE